ncbi:hypothetical protein E1A91_A10G035800v1 [Gossypium mustelinum]|uniref:Bidirectional sugar transporter SWEET n=1 Tax=Gossypium mustelinum TaxID=34275 RepID=A0A5D2XGQ2_GOSMU|nr:hypothetical protein E1A91_A10G035800v1 [Gossypium mustelinum]
MSLTIISSVYEVCSDAAGIAGNIFAFGLFLSPIPTFRRIIRNGSTEQFSGMPYIYALLNCLICLWYGFPIISPGIILEATVNSIGAVFQLIYIIIFIAYATKPMKLKMLGFLVSVFAVFASIVFVSLQFLDSSSRQLFIGYLSVASLISMFASPLLIIAPNGIGTVLGTVQLALYAYFKRASQEELRHPLIVP